jgi:hypothetical protein
MTNNAEPLNYQRSATAVCTRISNNLDTTKNKFRQTLQRVAPFSLFHQSCTISRIQTVCYFLVILMKPQQNPEYYQCYSY